MKIVKSGIYVIYTPKNFIYIGQSVNLNRRLKDYINKSSRIKGQPKIYESINRLGWEGHTFTVLEHCKVEELNNKERYWQDKFECTNPLFGLNLVLQNSDARRRKFSDEYKKKLSERTRDKGNPFYGKKHTEENKQKWSEQIKGEKHQYYGITGESHPAYGNILSEESKKKISKRHKGVPKSKEHNEKVRLALIKVKGVKVIRTTDGKKWNSVSECIEELNIPKTTFYRNIKKERNKFNLKYI